MRTFLIEQYKQYLAAVDVQNFRRDGCIYFIQGKLNTVYIASSIKCRFSYSYNEK